MAIIKYTDYKKHASIKVIKNRMVKLNNLTFSLDLIYWEEIVKGIDKLCSKKASQNTDIPVKIIKEKKYLISNFQTRCHALPLLMPWNMSM